MRAAGCLVWRNGAKRSGSVRDDGDDLEVLIVHRDRYDDWSFPKGKLEPNETELECALREVAEETNMGGVVGAELPIVRYVDHKGRDKTVRYWLLRHTDGEFEPNDEVDRVRWVSPEEAARVLSYTHDISLLDHLGATTIPKLTDEVE